MSHAISLERINKLHISHYADKLREFHSTKCGLRAQHTNRIQAALVQMLRNQSIPLNNVPNLEQTGDLDNLLDYIRNIPNVDQTLINNLQYMSSDFIGKYGLMKYAKEEIISSNLLELAIRTMTKKIHETLLKYLNEKELELGFQIYNLEKDIPKDLFNYFLTDPGIDNLQFDVINAKIFEAMKLRSNDDFLWHLSQIGINSEYNFFYDSEAVRYYNTPSSIQIQSLQIRNQIKNAYTKVKDEINYLITKENI